MNRLGFVRRLVKIWRANTPARGSPWASFSSPETEAAEAETEAAVFPAESLYSGNPLDMMIPQMKRLDDFLEAETESCSLFSKEQIAKEYKQASLQAWTRPAFFVFLVAQVVISFLEQTNGTEYVVQLASINGSQPVLTDLYGSGERLWVRRFLLFSSNSSTFGTEYGSSICSSTNMHAMEGVISLIWLIHLTVSYVLKYNSETNRR